MYDLLYLFFVIYYTFSFVRIYFNTRNVYFVYFHAPSTKSSPQAIAGAGRSLLIIISIQCPLWRKSQGVEFATAECSLRD